MTIHINIKIVGKHMLDKFLNSEIRLLDVVSCEFKKKMFKERRSCGSNEGPVKFLSTRDLLSC
jgi:hypothetical protein